MIDFDATLKAYIECALWSSYDYPPGVDPEAPDSVAVHLDQWEGTEGSLDESARIRMAADVADFLMNAPVLHLIEQLAIEPGQVGHDFWLTRNGHGAGFWDRGPEPERRQLADLCEPYGDADLYIGDDGRIYHA